MSSYNFKSIQVVPGADDFINIILSKTQRKTPTVVHKGYHIARIRSFYMRKVKYTQHNYTERLGQILDDFPKLDDIHPFYAALMNVLYDKDHYKLALGQINTARHLIDNVGKDYVRLLKFGDSLFRCKSLKRAALGRMCTIIKKQKNSLGYLERVRQHLARLPSIDPTARTLIVCGYPNVGKSSFMNKVTQADVDVQPYAFTTKSLYVGHMDYKLCRWQVIDTPGILDHPLQDMNEIEMQSVTALAHLRAAVLFFVDISEQCGYTIEQQVNLFNNVKPLFTNKPLTLVLNKIDVVRPDDMSEEHKSLLQGLLDENVEMMAMSGMTDEGVMDVKKNSCDRLLQMRVEAKLAGKKIESILNRLHVAQPRPDGVDRPPIIPEAVLERQAAKRSGMDVERRSKRLEKDIELEHGGPGQYSGDWKKNYMLENDDWKYDQMPEIMDGHNVADFIDPEILARLEELDREEEALEAQMDAEEATSSSEDEDVAKERKLAVREIRKRKKVVVAAHRENKGKNSTSVQRNKKAKVSVAAFREKMKKKGIDQNAAEAAAARMIDNAARRDERHQKEDEAEDAADGAREPRKRKRSRSETGFRNVKQRLSAEKLGKQKQKKMNKLGKAGEADRHIASKLPKHLNSGKRGKGKTDRR